MRGGGVAPAGRDDPDNTGTAVRNPVDTIVESLRDDEVDETLDQQLRTLLTRCFTGPQDVVFQTRRYFHEPCARRWLVRGGRGGISAHVALHDKTVHAGNRVYRIGGVAEVCVHPDVRGRGLVKLLLGCCHDWLKDRGIPYAVLMGDPRIYSSSGYHGVTNLYCDVHQGKYVMRQVLSSAMVCPMSDVPWPRDEVFLPGLPF
jgi:GNAT superfamily N-acetyltransferase